MVAKRRERGFQGTQASIVVEIIEDDTRPSGTRGRWALDPRVTEIVQKVIKTAEHGGSVRVKLVDPKLLEGLAMHARHYVVEKGKFKLRTQKLPDGYIRLYAEK